ncbi:hypothetical protein F511_12371 [Dorcoceras hygrometricum]|uniref:Uncharacterized protein n=1 Tax=Dorcoceras hygrometricum TaxID=472368 RepID=A0A2Z7DKN2_9LAMI|nr:hypothetical protein F511_12371 [Dorcoceras hygrometricum]
MLMPPISSSGPEDLTCSPIPDARRSRGPRRGSISSADLFGYINWRRLWERRIRYKMPPKRTRTQRSGENSNTESTAPGSESTALTPAQIAELVATTVAQILASQHNPQPPPNLDQQAEEIRRMREELEARQAEEMRRMREELENKRAEEMRRMYEELENLRKEKSSAPPPPPARELGSTIALTVHGLEEGGQARGSVGCSGSKGNRAIPPVHFALPRVPHHVTLDEEKPAHPPLVGARVPFDKRMIPFMGEIILGSSTVISIGTTVISDVKNIASDDKTPPSGPFDEDFINGGEALIHGSWFSSENTKFTVNPEPQYLDHEKSLGDYKTMPCGS